VRVRAGAPRWAAYLAPLSSICDSWWSTIQEGGIMKKSIAVFLVFTAAMAAHLSNAYAAEKHLIYIHGCCINKVGSSAYEDIVKNLKASGFKVTFDIRRDESDDDIKAYALKVAEQVNALLVSGASPEDITVVGYSQGAVVALYAAINIANPNVNYVLLAGCPGPRARRFDIDYSKVQGRVLSIIDVKDDRFMTCKGILSESVLQKEITLDSGYGHEVFRRSDEKSIQLWKEPLESWAKR